MRKTLSFGLALALVAGLAIGSQAAATKKPVAKAKAPTPAVSATPTVTTTELIEMLEQSEANWALGTIHTTGVGLAPERGALLLRRDMARREAYEDSHQAMLDAIEQIRVTGDATVRDYMVADESLKTKLSSLIKYSQISDGKQLPDGSMEVSLNLPMFGDSGLSSILLDKPVEALASGSVGLVIDARGSGAQPALAPQIKSRDGKVLYDIPGVRYYHSVDAAKAAVENPTVVKAKLSGGATRANLILDENNAKLVKPGLGRGSITIVL